MGNITPRKPRKNYQKPARGKTIPCSIDEKNNSINHPSHYTRGSIECIDAIMAALTPSEFRGYIKGNILKYIWREYNKNGVEDLKKARWYLDRLIKNMENPMSKKTAKLSRRTVRKEADKIKILAMRQFLEYVQILGIFKRLVFAVKIIFKVGLNV